MVDRETISEGAREAVAALRREEEAYARGEDRPLGSYLGLLGAFGAAVLGLSSLARARGAALPQRPATADIALVAAATHKLSRLLAKDPVTSPLRSPFTRYAGVSGESELAEEARGTGVRHAIAELVTCPFCLDVWTATGFTFGLVLAPRATRLAASTLAAITGADFLQLAYAAVEQRATGS